MSFEAKVKLVGLVTFLLVAGLIAAIEFRGSTPVFSVTMNGNAASEMFVCGQLKPGELTCLDLETYAARLKAHLEAQKRTDM